MPMMLMPAFFAYSEPRMNRMFLAVGPAPTCGAVERMLTFALS